MAGDTELMDEVLDALESDEGVTAVLALRAEPDTFIVGSRNTGNATWGTMMFVIALEDQRGTLDQSGHERLQNLKEAISFGSSTKGTAWYGIASTARTAVRISRGEVQLEPPNGS